MLTAIELDRMEREFWSCVCAAGDTGGMSLVEVADQATRSLSRLLGEHKELLREHAELKAWAAGAAE